MPNNVAFHFGIHTSLSVCRYRPSDQMGLHRYQAQQDGQCCAGLPERTRRHLSNQHYRLLTDNGKEFTDRFVGSKDRLPTGRHDFDQLCKALGIEHRLTRPRTPQTNGMVECFNGRISDILNTHHFHSGEALEKTMHRYVSLYNHDLPQAALGSATPVSAMKQWFKTNPELFHCKPYDRTECDSY